MTDDTQFPTLGFPADASDLPPPDEIGGFRILSVLGRGGMGIVYEAEQEEPRRRVDALGLLARTLQSQSHSVEAEAAAREALAIRMRLQGPDSGPTADAMDGLAFTLDGTGDFKEAESLAAAALAIRRRVFGPRSEEVGESGWTCIGGWGKADKAAEFAAGLTKPAS
jgi:hypothetical protein